MTENSIKLGLMPPLTGLVGIYGREIAHAGQVACQEINENGGVLGRPLELIIEDDGSMPESAVIAARKLVDEHQCIAIIGNLLSNSRIAVAYRVAEPSKIPFLNFSFYEGSILSRYFFHFAALPNQQIDKMIPYMREKFGPRMFFAGNNYEWPRGSIHAGKLALERVGGEVVGEEYTPIGVSPEIIEQLLDHVEETNPDVFVPYFAGSDQVMLLTRFTERGLKGRMAVVMGHYDEMMASQLSPEVRDGFYSSNTYFMTVDTAENRNYLERLGRLPDVNGIWPNGNGILTNFGEGTYVCVKAFAEAVNKTGSLDAEVLVDALKQIEICAPQGTVSMSAEHHHAKVNTYLSRCNADGIFSIIEKFGAIPPVLPERYNHQRIANQATIEDDIRLQARMLEQMTDGVILISTQDNKVIYANLGAVNIFGYNKEEILDMPLSVFNAKNPLADQSYAEMMAVLAQKGEWEGQNEHIKKGGASIWCSVSVSTFTHPVFGEVWLAVYRDITERKLAAEELRKSEELLQEKKALLEQALADKTTELQKNRMLFDLSPIGLVLTSMGGKIITVNQAYADIIGRSIEECYSLNYWDITPENYSAMEKTQLESLHRTGKYGPYEKEYCHKNGSLVPVRLSGMVLNTGGDAFIWSSVENISDIRLAEQELRVSESRYRRAEHGTNDGLWEWDIVTGEDYFSPRWLALLGYEPGELPYTVETFIDLIHPEDLSDVKDAIDAHIHSNDPYDEEMRLRHKNGEYIWVQSRGQVARDMQGEPVRMTGFITNITERKKAEKELELYRGHLEELVEDRTTELKVAKEEAERANKLKSEFLGRMSHELRTPMNAILGFGQLLEEEALTDDQDSFTYEIMHAAKHLMGLIDEVLDLTKIESGNIDVYLEPVSVAEVINESISIASTLADTRKIRIENIISDEQLSVRADRIRLKEVILNLLSNAIKYNVDNGSVVLNSMLANDGKMLRINVIDTGKGLDDKKQVLVFEPFNRLGEEYSEIQGTGIGLTITKQLVDLMGGNIGLSSMAGEGSTFWVELPLAESAESKVSKGGSRQSDVINTKVNKTILYVEDNPANMRLVQRALEKYPNWHLYTADTAENGIEIARNKQPDLVMLDLNLPGMDGYEALARLRNYPETANLVYVALSAAAMPRDIERGFLAGFKRYLTKPILLNELREVLEQELQDRKIGGN